MRVGYSLIVLLLSITILTLSVKAQSIEHRPDPVPGSITFWGTPSYDLDVVPAGDDFIAIATGDFHAIALREDGSLVAWGAGLTNTGVFPEYGQSIVPAGDNFIAIAAGDYHSLALRADGLLISWGRNNYGQTNVPGGNNYIAISCGALHSLALRYDGTIAAWGAGLTNTGTYPHFGQSIVPPGNDYLMIAGGATHSMALRENGTLDAWGRNNYGQIEVPEENDFVSISARNYHNLALRVDGSITAWGRNTSGQCNVPVGETYHSISAGREHSLAIRSDGTLDAWGINSSGQTDLPGGNHYRSITAGYQHNLALTSLEYGLLSPNGGEFWSAGSEHLIRWYYRGSEIDLQLQYTHNGGTDWIDIVITSSADWSFPWTTPLISSDQYRIRGIFFWNDTEYVMESETNFTVTSEQLPYITLTSPLDASIRWQTGKVYEISWVSSFVEQVDIFLSIDNGLSWTGIASQVPAENGSFSWTVPDTPSNTARIRLQDSVHPFVDSISPVSFSLVKLEFSDDLSGLELIGGEFFTLEFSPFFSYRFRLFYSADNGNNWSIIENDLDQTYYTWLIPNINSDEVMLLLEDYYAPEINAQSTLFSINSPITLLSPNGGENLLSGTDYLIEWMTSDELTNVLIDYSPDYGFTWIPVTTVPYPAADGSYTWLVPDVFSTECLVKVKSVTNINSYGVSNSPFVISDRAVTVLQPSGGEMWSPGSEQLILWEVLNVSTVDLSFSYDGGTTWLLIAEDLPAGSSPYLWEIPNIGTMAGKVKVRDAEIPQINNVSTGLFTILYYNPPLNLSAEVTNDGVALNWEPPLGEYRVSITNSRLLPEINRRIPTRERARENRWNLEGYNLYRDGIILNQEPLTTTSYHDYDVTIGVSYSYYVTALYDEAESEPSNVVEVTVTSATEELQPVLVTGLMGNYPNPFNPATTIIFSLAEQDQVTITIYNNRGQLVQRLFSGYLPAGEQRIIWDGIDERNKQVGSGVYLYRMQTSGYSATGKMLLLK